MCEMQTHTSFYQPRERCGPGYITPESEIKKFWNENAHKFWNPERGVYEDALLCESMNIIPTEVKFNPEHENFIKECEEALAAGLADMQTVEAAIESEIVLSSQVVVAVNEPVAA